MKTVGPSKSSRPGNSHPHPRRPIAFYQLLQASVAICPPRQHPSHSRKQTPLPKDDPPLQVPHFSGSRLDFSWALCMVQLPLAVTRCPSRGPRQGHVGDPPLQLLLCLAPGDFPSRSTNSELSAACQPHGRRAAMWLMPLARTGPLSQQNSERLRAGWGGAALSLYVVAVGRGLSVARF